MSELRVGTIAPAFNADSTDGQVSLERFQGKNIILYFYPKDLTSGCTVQARDFTSLLQEFRDLDTQIIGVSRDNLASHNRFCEKEGISYPLLIDIDGKICKSYNVLKEKSMFGKKYIGISRTTFLIGKNAKILNIWNNVKTNNHALNVLDVIKKLDRPSLPLKVL